MISKPKNIDDYKIKMNIPILILLAIVIFSIFYISDLHQTIHCYKTIDRDDCNKVFNK